MRSMLPPRRTAARLDVGRVSRLRAEPANGRRGVRGRRRSLRDSPLRLVWIGEKRCLREDELWSRLGGLDGESARAEGEHSERRQLGAPISIIGRQEMVVRR